MDIMVIIGMALCLLTLILMIVIMFKFNSTCMALMVRINDTILNMNNKIDGMKSDLYDVDRDLQESKMQIINDLKNDR